MNTSITNPMHHSKRKLGGRLVQPIGLGCMGMSEFYGATDDAKSMEVLQAAIELGVEHLDTADMYGDGHNEILIGKFLSQSIQRDKVFLATKCGIVRDSQDRNLRGVDNSPEYILQACHRSLDRLGTHIDLFYLHRIADDGAHIEKSMESMATLLNEGKIKSVGLSEANAATIQRANDALLRLTDNRHSIAAIQSEYSLLTRTVEQNEVLQTCINLDIALVAYSPISRGLLSDDLKDVNALEDIDFRRSLPRFESEAFHHNQYFVGVLQTIAQKYNATSSQIALAFVSKPVDHSSDTRHQTP